MKRHISIFIVLTILISSCHKDMVADPNTLQKIVDPADSVLYTPNDKIYTKSTAILIDASKDGGVWWFPQSPISGFSATGYHQGKDLADYLRSMGYRVHEIPRGAIITERLLNNYSKVIRAGGMGNYTAAELAAYESFLSRPSSLLLLQDHLTNFSNDQLSAGLGIAFEGAQSGTINQFAVHPVTVGVNSFPFMTGAVVRNPIPVTMTILGTINTSPAQGVMGIVHHPTSKIFFIGDTNGIETIPQPFTSNLVRWLFN